MYKFQRVADLTKHVPILSVIQDTKFCSGGRFRQEAIVSWPDTCSQRFQDVLTERHGR